MTVIGEPDNTPPRKLSDQKAVPFEMASLNEHSARFAAYLFGQRPEWRHFATSEEGVLFISIPSPVAGRSLWIDTHNSEVTVGFSPGVWHEHFYAEMTNATDEEAFASAIAIIDLIVNENALIAETRTHNDETRSWGIIDRDAKIAPPPRGRKIVLMSWRGTYDREVRSSWLQWLRGLGR